MNQEKCIKKALDVGFSYVQPLDCSTLELREDVRQMCEANMCGMYAKNWSCPPGCGDLEVCRRRVGNYHWGILVQTVGEIEDSFDFEAMEEIERKHKEIFQEHAKYLKEYYPGLLALSAGCCTICKKCTYPDASCRFPDRCVSSMESYGILVNDLCKKNDMTYYYGEGKMAYTSCYLLE